MRQEEQPADMGQTPYFPIFVNLENRRILVAGAGTIACRRIRTLLEFKAAVTVVAPAFQEELEQLGKEGKIRLVRRKAGEEEWEGLFLFLACTDDAEENKKLCRKARAFGVFANNCSEKEDCDFYFPSVIRREDLVIGINAGGSDHRKVKEVRKKLEAEFNVSGIYRE